MITVLFHADETLGSVELRWNQVTAGEKPFWGFSFPQMFFFSHRCFKVTQRLLVFVWANTIRIVVVTMMWSAYHLGVPDRFKSPSWNLLFTLYVYTILSPTSVCTLLHMYCMELSEENNVYCVETNGPSMAQDLVKCGKSDPIFK